jgi:hypothetical protein
MNQQLELIRTVVLACSQAWAAAQQQAHGDQRPGSSRLKVFLDGHTGFEDQIRAEVDFVEYVHDCHQADVHVLVTSSPVENGRRQYSVAFTGFGRFEGIQSLAEAGIGQRGTSETATSEINRGRPDTTARDRRHALRERGAIIA